MATSVPGYCPMGCGTTLFIGSGGYITCSLIKCPNPSAVSDILADPEPDHIVTFDENTFTVKHPLRERLADALLDCQLHAYCADLPGPPPQLGTYRVKHSDTNGRWYFARLETT